MIVGVSYNVFSGEEHLVHSLRTMRGQVDYINLVVQYVSNQGHAAPQSLHETLQQVAIEKLADAVLAYDPDLSLPAVVNEHRKRNLGLQLAKRAGVTHFMTMDCDEYYLASEFARAKELIVDDKLRTTAVHTYLHIRRPIYRSCEPDSTCCAFLTELEPKSEIVLGDHFPGLVDPTRRLHGDRPEFRLFAPEIVAMRHMNLVRRDLGWKLKNSTNAGMTEFMDNVREAYRVWTFGSELIFPNKPPMRIIEVPDLFGIDPVFERIY
jgi:hypothetical protein